MRASGRRRGLTISAAFPVAVATVLAVVLPLSHGAPAAAPGLAKTGAVRADGVGPIGRGDSGVVTAGGGRRLPVVFLPGSGFHYLPIHGAAGGGWSVGPPCTPS